MSMLALANIFAGRRRPASVPRTSARTRGRASACKNASPPWRRSLNPPDSETTRLRFRARLTEHRQSPLIGYDSPAPAHALAIQRSLRSHGHGTGGGYSKYHDLTLTRWRSDPTCVDWGQFIYLRDVNTGRTWSATYQPTRAKPDAYQVTYSIDKAEFQRRDGKVETHLEIAVSPRHSAEVRYVKLTNHSATRSKSNSPVMRKSRSAQRNAGRGAPGVSKAVRGNRISSPHQRDSGAASAAGTRKEKAPWAAHVLAVGPGASRRKKHIEFESSREKFLGRGTHARRSGGARRRYPPERFRRRRPRSHFFAPLSHHRSAARIGGCCIHHNLCATRDEAVSLAESYHELRGVLRAFEMAWAFKPSRAAASAFVAGEGPPLSTFGRRAVVSRPVTARGGGDPARESTRAERVWKYGISGGI